ncbi:hypothetical protein DDB_G0272506 [Dictyostelium discoideum AX4]|uniref:Putative uncharacterized protein DDB_G0272506 n=1 Tax=Dictyostelium discoideum TaxID=44689 RepID=Y8853_DICDI|nr:hypothetical protein DDB_G0272506 [Dictyostelium discoideum AX4]Q7KWU5.1 RecName: Full=Putative uncharacterized protein DDB_G0272506 [Dictyostelium discoideum]EAL71177.1 hypothetical protein DDB_G0272506 [Dictyostelium discoideum AX4]|eukprot:XP_645116.1 hypothetical protein DDB_G0272506 [Dictyostelium discoideum AX4]
MKDYEIVFTVFSSIIFAFLLFRLCKFCCVFCCALCNVPDNVYGRKRPRGSIVVEENEDDGNGEKEGLLNV